MPTRKLRFVAAVLIVLVAAALAQTGANPGPANDAQKQFALLKGLSGLWYGTMQASSADIPAEQLPDKGKPMPGQARIHVTSMGNAILHEMHNLEEPDDPAHWSHPITMFYVEGDRLMVTHYCDMGNRPTMAAAKPADPHTVAFDMVNLSGPKTPGYMNRIVFTQIDATHHNEDWYALIAPGEKPVKFHMELKRMYEMTGSELP